jgi:hypothetical protein
MKEQFNNVVNVVKLITAHQPQWTITTSLLRMLSEYCDQLRDLMEKCGTTSASSDDRMRRNSLLRTTVGICLKDIRVWAFGLYLDGIITIDDLHQLGFLFLGENGKHRDRTEATNVLAEVKVIIVNEDFIRATIDQSSGENAALVVHGWPDGVKNAVIVITASDGVTEVYRKLTTHLHNDIEMPKGSHGKQFLIKAAFLKHVDDEPRYGNQPTFTMPKDTADLVATIDRQHHEEFEEQQREIERHRQEVEKITPP